MQQPKLLLPWNGSTIIDCVLRAWCNSNVSYVTVVLRRDDVTLSKVCEKWPVEIVRADRAPRDMKESIQLGLRRVVEVHEPTGRDRWMVAPADLPQLDAGLINQLIAAAASQPGVTVPRFGGRQGHPVLLPWGLSADVFALGADEGLDRVLEKQEINFVHFPAKWRATDVDTPEEYVRLKDDCAVSAQGSDVGDPQNPSSTPHT